MSLNETLRKLLYLFLAITIISCGGDDDGNNTTEIRAEYVGTWSAVYSGDGFGDALVIVSSTGDVSGYANEIYEITGTVTNSGVLNATAGSVADGFNTTWEGVLTTEGTGSGTWSGSGFSGEWVAVKN